MRVLAIRGRNLASLHGAFEVDFTCAPLARAGLFAISGPTGAGKSTLLDALCLALYHHTPRLARASGRGINLPDVGSDTLSPQDPRNLLRRGAGEAYAEVDFVGNDHLTYRAHWGVRRAGGKPRGRMQQAEVSLHVLPDQSPVGGKLKGEVREAIEQRIGLSFEQFTRAVLLAQNEFHAFLKAADDERASLLQTLTGTDLFEQISRKAFERARTEREALEQIQARMADQQPLADEARAELQARQQAARADIRTLDDERDALATRQRTREHWLQSQAQASQAQSLLQQAQDERAAAQPRRDRLARAEEAQAASPAHAECLRLAALIPTQEESLLQARAVHRAAVEREEVTRHTQQRAQTALEHARRNRSAAQPALDQARELDTRLGALRQQHDQTRHQADEAHTALAHAQTAHDEAALRLAGTRADLSAAEEWLALHQHLEPLADPALQWESKLDEAARRLAEQQTAIREQTTLGNRLTRHQAAVAEHRVALHQATSLLDQRHTAAQHALAGWQSFDPASLANRRRQLNDALQIAIDAESHQRELDTQEALIQRLTAALQQGEQEAQGCRAHLQTLGNALSAAQARQQQAARALHLARAACGDQAEALRAQLAPDTACPVCGALEHPYGHDAAPHLRQLLQQLEAEHSAAETTGNTLSREEAGEVAKLEALQAQMRKTRTELIETESIHVRCASRLAESPLASALSPLPGAQRQAWLNARIATQREALEALTAEEHAQNQARQALDQANNHWRHASEGARQAETALHKAEAELLATQQAQDHQIALAARAADALAPLLHQLESPLARACGGNWLERWRADPPGIHALCTQLASAWLTHQHTGQRLAQQLALHAHRVEALAAVLTQSQSNAAGAQGQFQAVDTQLNEVRTRRQALLGGATVEVFSQALESALRQAEVELDLAQAAGTEAALARTRAEENLTRAEVALSDCRQQHADAQARLDQWLANHPAIGNRETLAGLLSHGPDWLQQERLALQALDATVTRAASVLEERQKHCLALTPPMADDLAADAPQRLAEALTANRATADAARLRENEAALRLHQDDLSRNALAALGEAFTRQQARQILWARMNELIGSADGKKFRNYAQQITLDVLLNYANHHLAHLARRYRLERVPESLALLVVDQDMGDERRSVHSLSGGESFLLSLSLALALASLSAHRVRVESLFIDEGFGSLDPETLRVAVDALDRLQAQGRKVGIISHVQELTERIGARIEVLRGPGGASRIRVSG